MSELHRATKEDDQPEWYEIRVAGRLDPRWTERFDGMSFIHPSDGTTLLTGPVIDQAALHSVLRKVRDLGLTLLSVMQVAAKPTAGADNQESKS